VNKRPPLQGSIAGNGHKPKHENHSQVYARSDITKSVYAHLPSGHRIASYTHRNMVDHSNYQSGAKNRRTVQRVLHTGMFDDSRTNTSFG
jgi:hypothetical protein